MAFVPAEGRVVGSKYRLVRRIAGGGMGSVWSARHLTLDVDVAVKLMSSAIADTPTALSRFEREAKASAQLKSKNIVKVQDYGIEDGMPFMVMELLEGEDLGSRLARVGKLSLAELSPLFTEICRGLKVAHDAGIVHRDLKPSNVFLAREGDEEIVKLCDFGVARETKTHLVDEKTSSGVVVGSPHHMSPEQAMAAPVDHRSDLWSLGVLAYRALSGTKPFEGEALTAVMLAVVSKPIPKITDAAPDLPPDADRFVERALCRDVDRRFQTAMAMAEALRAIAEGRDASALLAPPPPAEVRGRDEATAPAVSAAIPPASTTDVGSAGTPPSEATASRELRAVTSGVSLKPSRSRAARIAPWIALVAAVGGIGFYFGRAGSTPPAASGTAGTSGAPTSAAAPTTTPIETTEPTVEPAVSAAPSGGAAPIETAATSASSPPAAKPVARPGGGRPPAPAKRIDDFTGLPTP